ncbi:MAG: proton-conducting transporter membrane subunit, partial [Angelakisella sp.]
MNLAMPELFCFVAPDGLRWLHLLIAAAAFSLSLLYTRCCIPVGRRRSFVLPALVTLGATAGIFLSGSLFTLFVCFEVMSMASYLLVIHPRTPAARRAGGLYLGVAVIGGLCMLLGLLLIFVSSGTLELALLPVAAGSPHQTLLWVAGILLLVGFGAKAGMFPLHVWLPSSYTEAPYPGTMVLSAALSTAGTFGLLVLGCTIFYHDASWGKLLLLLGTVTMLLGGVLAVASTSLKTTLAYSSMSQIGFILVGIGMQGVLGEHNALAARGTVLHIMNHSLCKLVLFAVAAVLFQLYGTHELAKLKGAGRGKPLLHLAFLTGGAAIAGVPLLSGYVSKTLLHESLVEAIALLPMGSEQLLLRGVEVLFLLSGGLTVAYIAKLYYTLFLGKPDEQAVPQRAALSRGWELLPLLPALPLLTGILPNLTLDSVADWAQGMLRVSPPAHAVQYFSPANLQGAAISLTIGALLFFLLRLLPHLRPVLRLPKLHFSLLEQLYLPVVYRLLPLILAILGRLL